MGLQTNNKTLCLLKHVVFEDGLESESKPGTSHFGICHEKETRNVSFQDKDMLLSGLERRLPVKGKDPEEKAPFWASISNSLERGIYCSLKENISSMLELSK